MVSVAPGARETTRFAAVERGNFRPKSSAGNEMFPVFATGTGLTQPERVRIKAGKRVACMCKAASFFQVLCFFSFECINLG